MEPYKEEWKRNSWCLVSFALNHTDTRWTSLRAQLHTCKHTHKQITKCVHNSTFSRKYTHAQTACTHTCSYSSYDLIVNPRYALLSHCHSWEMTSDRCGSITVMTNASLYLCFLSPEHPGRQKGRAKHIITMFGTKDRLTTPHYQSQGEIVYLLLLDGRQKWDQTGCCSVLIKVGLNWHFTNSPPRETILS